MLTNSAYLSEKAKIDNILINTTSTDMTSRNFSMVGYDRAAVLIAVGAYGSSALAGGGPMTARVLVGPATEAVSSFAALVGATAAFNTATAGAITKAQQVRITLSSSAYTTAHTFTINGVAFNSSSTLANSGLKQWTVNTIATAVAQSLSTLLQTHLGTNINTTYSGAGTIAYVDLETKDSSTFITIATTAQATAGGGGVADAMNFRPMRQYAIIEFTAADLVSTASSYTDFAVQLSSSGAGASSVPKSVTIIRYNCDLSPVNFTSTGVPVKVGQST